MQVIGLTGGIGTGKSTVSGYLKDWGFAVIDADQIARQIVEPGKPLLAELEHVFGSSIIRQDGTLDRKGLAAVVFQDTEKRKILDHLMHGTILDEIERKTGLYKQEKQYKGVIIDAPLLFETGLDQKCSQVWLVTASEDLRIQRVCARDQVSEEQVRDRIRNQMPEEEKKKMADCIIDNSGSRNDLEKHLEQMLYKNGFSL